MATLATLIAQTRRYLRDYPEQETLSTSLSSSGTSIAVSGNFGVTLKRLGTIDIDTETMVLSSIGASTTHTILRAARGSTAATHASAATVLIEPAFHAVEIVDALNEAMDAMFPYVYKPVDDQSITIATNTYEYTLPTMPSDSTARIWRLSKIYVKETGDAAWRELRYSWEIIRGATPKIKFRRLLPNGAGIRLVGYGPFPRLAATTDTTDALFPRQAEFLLSVYAAGWLLGSGEAGRVRIDRGVRDERESANRPLTAIGAGDRLLNRFYRRLNSVGMPPMPAHLINTL